MVAANQVVQTMAINPLEADPPLACGGHEAFQTMRGVRKEDSVDAPATSAKRFLDGIAPIQVLHGALAGAT